MSRKQITKKNEQRFSQFLSFILRHKPEEIGLKLEDNGWVNVSELIKAINTSEASNWEITMTNLEDIVASDNKQRYSFNESKTKIRANQGHSIKDLKMEYREVNITGLPEYLYHGTSTQNYEKIAESGSIKPMSRQLVHLSKDIETASKVGNRHGELVLLQINTRELINSNHKIYISENGVYLVDEVPFKYIQLC